MMLRAVFSEVLTRSPFQLTWTVRAGERFVIRDDVSLRQRSQSVCHHCRAAGLLFRAPRARFSGPPGGEAESMKQDNGR